MPLRGCVGENVFWRGVMELSGTGTHETYETHATHGTGTMGRWRWALWTWRFWDWD